MQPLTVTGEGGCSFSFFCNPGAWLKLWLPRHPHQRGTHFKDASASTHLGRPSRVSALLPTPWGSFVLELISITNRLDYMFFLSLCFKFQLSCFKFTNKEWAHETLDPVKAEPLSVSLFLSTHSLLSSLPPLSPCLPLLLKHQPTWKSWWSLFYNFNLNVSLQFQSRF